MPLFAPRLSKELICLLSLWLIATLCLLGKSNSLQKYWTQRHHATLPVSAPFATIDGMAQDAVDAAMQDGPLAFLSRQDPNEFTIPTSPAPRMALARQITLRTDPVPAVAASVPSAAAAIPAVATTLPARAATHPVPAASASAPAIATPAATATASASASVDSIASAPPTMAVAAQANANTSPTPPTPPASPMPTHYAKSEKLALTKDDKILFAGDSLMQGLVPHITRGLRRDGFSHYLDASKQSTGFSYPATFDWSGKIKTAIMRDGVNTVVIFIGANDAWSLASGGKLYSFGSAPWRAEYTRRVREVVQFAHQHKARVVWLELPPMQYDNLTKGRQVLNDIYRQVAQEESALFIPTARVVSDDQEKFGLFKTLADGKTAQTRLDDGVHFTKLGQTLISKAVLQHFSVQEAQQ